MYKQGSVDILVQVPFPTQGGVMRAIPSLGQSSRCWQPPACTACSSSVFPPARVNPSSQPKGSHSLVHYPTLPNTPVWHVDGYNPHSVARSARRRVEVNHYNQYVTVRVIDVARLKFRNKRKLKSYKFRVLSSLI